MFMNSRFWKSIDETTFVVREDGDWDFFPYGILKGGYRVNSLQREFIDAALHRFYTFLIIVLCLCTALGTFAIAVPGGFLWIVLAAVIYIAVVVGYWCVRLRPLWRNLPRSERRLRIRDTLATMARPMPKWQIVCQLIVGLIFGLCSLFLLWIGFGDTWLRTIGGSGFLFSLLVIWTGAVWWRKRRALERRSN